MFRSYFKIGWRNLLKEKGYAVINIGGLAVGMAVAILNGLWIWDELSFNMYHKNYERIVQVAERGEYREEKWASTTMSYPLGVELRENYKHDFKHVVRTSWTMEMILSTVEMKRAGKGLFADAEAPEMFTFNMVQGSRSGLKEPHSILISETLSKALFGDANPIEQTVALNNSTIVKVTGVFEDLPMNTHFHGIEFFAPWSLWLMENKWIEADAVNDWDNHFSQVYAELLPGAQVETIDAQLKAIKQKKVAEPDERQTTVFLFPMSQWHLFPFDDDRGGTTNKEPVQMVLLVGAIGMFVLFLACINFMNLSTARSEKRAKEVGIRKTIGSVRTQLIYQFFSESYMVVVLAFLLAIVVVNLGLPWFNGLAAKQMSMPWSLPIFWIVSVGFIFIAGLLAGSYPALYLSSFQPVKVLKGTFKAGRFASLPRKVLVVLQFTVSVSLIICTIVVYQQIQFAKSRPVGYTREGLITLEMKSNDFYVNFDALRNELKNSGAVEEVSGSMGQVTEVWSGNSGFDWRGKDPNKEESFGTLTVTHDHGKTVGWQFVQGRDFSREFASDSLGMVINEAAARYMGLKNPVGELVTWTWWGAKQPPLHYKILGVIKDMVMESPYAPTKPTVFYVKGHNGSVNWINIKINPDVSASTALPKIEAVFKKVIPSAPFDYKFVDQVYASKFAAEERIGKLAFFFGALAVFISCLGLFGLASFVAEQRTKEIGIRKILGASVATVWRMLSKDFVLLVLAGCFIAGPIAYYFLIGWLQKYEYRIEISWWVFALTGFVAIGITLLTVSYQAVKAGLVNPVDSLKRG